MDTIAALGLRSLSLFSPSKLSENQDAEEGTCVARVCCIRQHPSASVSMRQLTSEHAGCIRRQHTCVAGGCCIRQHPSASVGIRKHTSAYVSVRQHTSAHVSTRQHTQVASVSIRQHPSASVSIRQHTCMLSTSEKGKSTVFTMCCKNSLN